MLGCGLRVLTKEIYSIKERIENGIDVNINTVAQMVALCNYLDVDVEEYLGGEISQLKLRQSSYDL
jgi:hypothetical protein